MQMESVNHLVVLVTCPANVSETLARTLVQEKLVACVNIQPAITSIYSWKGELCQDQEALLIIKTRADLWETLRARVVELHPYEVPEVIALPLWNGHPPYLNWINETTQP